MASAKRGVIPVVVCAMEDSHFCPGLIPQRPLLQVSSKIPLHFPNEELFLTSQQVQTFIFKQVWVLLFLVPKLSFSQQHQPPSIKLQNPPWYIYTALVLYASTLFLLSNPQASGTSMCNNNSLAMTGEILKR